MSLYLAFSCLVFTTLFHHSFAQYEVEKGKIGEVCERDYHCIKNAFCRDQKTCLCEPNYQPVPDMSLCVPTIGLICDTNEVCALMSNAICTQNVCTCKETFTIDIRNASNCLPMPMAERDQCQRNDDCMNVLDRALCINDQCQCLTDHHFVLGTGKCVRNVGVFGTCEADYQCYTPDMGDQTDLLVCRDSRCRCNEGNTAGYCSGASTNSATIIAVLFLLFVKLFS